MVRKVNEHNDLDTAPVDGTQERTWTAITIAVSPGMKRDFFDLADKMHLAPSQYGRMLIADAIGRGKAA